MLTDEDTQLLEGAGALLRETRRQIGKLNEEVDRLRAENKALRSRNGAQRAALERAAVDVKLLRQRLNAPDALDAELWKARAEVWKEEARVLRLANAAPRLLRRGKGDE